MIRQTTGRVGRPLWPVPGALCSRQHLHARCTTYASTGERTLRPQGLPVPGRARWRLQVRVGPPAHALLKPPVRNITVGQPRARFRRGCVAWEPHRAIALPRQRL